MTMFEPTFNSTLEDIRSNKCWLASNSATSTATFWRTSREPISKMYLANDHAVEFHRISERHGVGNGAS